MITQVENTDAWNSASPIQNPKPSYPPPHASVASSCPAGQCRMQNCLIHYQFRKLVHNKVLEIRKGVSSLWGSHRELLMETYFFFTLIREVFYCSPLKKQSKGMQDRNRARRRTHVSLTIYSLKQLLMGKTHLIRSALWVELVQRDPCLEEGPRTQSLHTFQPWCVPNRSWAAITFLGSASVPALHF